MDKKKDFYLKAIRPLMELYRAGLSALPTEYIRFHEMLAKDELKRLESLGYRIHSSSMESDGWGDGMRVTVAVVENTKGELVKLVWHDSHDHGYWHERHAGGGSSLYVVEMPKRIAECQGVRESGACDGTCPSCTGRLL